MTVIIDLTQGDEVFGVNTSYYGGQIFVGEASHIIDGMTDRDCYGWREWVREQLVIQLGYSNETGDDEDQFNEELGLGNKYEATAIDGKLVIKEVTPDRQELKDRFWKTVGHDTYCERIESLLDLLTDDQLKAITEGL